MHDSMIDDRLQEFRNAVGVKFQLYNSLFTSLPFHKIEKTGILLSLFQVFCEERFDKGESPAEIVGSFISQNTEYKKEIEKADLLFRFVQYAERQVVLFDAIEEAAFPVIHDINGSGTLKQLELETEAGKKQEELAAKLNEFAVRLVLTAHPTQFYPDEVLGIIHDLSDALKNDNVGDINIFLQQLGKTPFFKKQKPAPLDESMSLVWYLEHVFYQAAGETVSELVKRFPESVNELNPVINLGFWPGGDRDGNPFVTIDTTIAVAAALRKAIIKCYLTDTKKLRHRLTFKGVDRQVAQLEQKLYNALYKDGPLALADITTALRLMRENIINDHEGFFLRELDEVIIKVRIFGLYFASLDIRQNSIVHKKTIAAIHEINPILPATYETMPEKEKINALLQILNVPNVVLNDPLLNDTVNTVKAVKQLQGANGEKGCHRYIISHTTSALNIIEVYALFRMFNSPYDLNIDVTPLFEMIEDLRNAGGIMKALYENEIYRNHLKQRGDVQHIMLGFSDGTKDGGYLMANWSIFEAKKELASISMKYGVEVVFFDGRGGPPARGGGKTHQFYASLGDDVAGKEIQLTIQGQTVSSNFGNVASARYNMVKLLHAGLSNSVHDGKKSTLLPLQEAIMSELAADGYKSYLELKEHPAFLDYLEHVSPLHFYGDANIGSRPAKRNSGDKINLDDLRAIPFVGAWSQIKQNVTAFYGVGYALQKMDANGRWNEIKEFYDQSLFFRALINNCEMAMMKSYLPLTAYLAEHKVYGVIWKMIYNEYQLTEKMILKLTGNAVLMGQYPVDRMSIAMRERIVLPLITIQQYALNGVRELDEQNGGNNEIRKTLEKLIMRCSFGIINAGRNSA